MKNKCIKCGGEHQTNMTPIVNYKISLCTKCSGNHVSSSVDCPFYRIKQAVLNKKEPQEKPKAKIETTNSIPNKYIPPSQRESLNRRKLEDVCRPDAVWKRDRDKVMSLLWQKMLDDCMSD